MAKPILTRDKVAIGIESVHISRTLAGLVQGDRAYCWGIAIDNAAKRIPKNWDGWPMQVLAPIGLSRKTDMPPKWRIAFLLGSGASIKQLDSDGSRLIVVCFRPAIDNVPMDELLRDIASDFDWMPHAADYEWP